MRLKFAFKNLTRIFDYKLQAQIVNQTYAPNFLNISPIRQAFQFKSDQTY